MDHGKILALDTPARAEAVRRRRHDRHGQGRRRHGRRSPSAWPSEIDGVTHTRVIDGGVELHVKAAERLVPRVVNAAESGGFDLVDLSVSEPSLETVFISLTGKELRD